MKNGNNFNEPPLTFDEFINVEGRSVPIYNNFFYNFYVYDQYDFEKDAMVKKYGRNYERLKTVNSNLAEELSLVYEKFNLARGYSDQRIIQTNLKGHQEIEGHKYPREILEKGYQAYLILREKFSKDKELLRRIVDYYEGYSENHPKYDDWPSFFS